MEDSNNQKEFGNRIFSKVVKAGKRTYFIDVRNTRGNDLYLTICESKRMFIDGSDRPVFDKRKIHLYKEDFSKFAEALNEAIDHIRVNYPEIYNSENRFHKPDGDTENDSMEPRVSDL